MRIKTLKEDLLIGDVIHPKGAIADVDDRIGKRLVESNFAVPMGPPAKATPVTGFETASAEPRRERAAART